MTDRDWYGDEGAARTALIFGEVRPGGAPGFTVAHFDADAYELYMVGPYAREMGRVHDDPDYVCWSPGWRTFGAGVRHLVEHHDARAFEEVGSTLFVSIDKLLKVEPSLKGALIYRGVEILPTLRMLAEMTHKDERVEHFNLAADLPQSAQPIISRSYQATSYAFTSTAELAAWIGRSALSIQGVWFSETGERTTSIMGKRLHLFDFATLRDKLAARGLETRVISAKRYGYGESETFVDGWVLHFDPKLISSALVEERLRAELGVEAVATVLAPPEGATPHASGLDGTRTSEHARDPTFNFASVGMNALFNKRD